MLPVFKKAKWLINSSLILLLRPVTSILFIFVKLILDKFLLFNVPIIINKKKKKKLKEIDLRQHKQIIING